MAEAGCKIYVIRGRMPGTEADVAGELQEYGLTYHVIEIMVDKARYILDEGIGVLYDDDKRWQLVSSDWVLVSGKQ